MSDDIYEQSAQQIINATRGMKATEGGLAEESGLRVRDGGHQNDAEMDTSWKTRGQAMGGDDGGAQARMMEENRQAIQAKRVIEDVGGLDWNDLFELSSNDGNEGRSNAAAIRKMVGVTNHAINQGAQRMVHDAYMNPNEATMMMEEEVYQPMQQEGWRVVKQAATLRSGKQIPVYVVEDSLSGMTTGKRYRVSVVAEKIARVLNATNNPDDNRVKMIENAYDQHVKYMQELSAAKKNRDASRVKIVEAKLSKVNASLGIS